eukprot:4979776-Amphidinium_carterae.1
MSDCAHFLRMHEASERLTALLVARAQEKAKGQGDDACRFCIQCGDPLIRVCNVTCLSPFQSFGRPGVKSGSSCAIFDVV